MNTPSKDYPRLAGDSLTELIYIVETLRGENGCPWDAQQTILSLRHHFLEEIYEVMEAMDNQDGEALSEELGDIVIHLLFQNDIAKKKGSFDWISVLEQARDKLKRRHPHVFGETEKVSVEEVERQWEMTKRTEQGRNSILKELPKGLPSLMAAASVLKRMKQVNVTDVVPTDKRVFTLAEGANSAEAENQAGLFLLQVASEVQQAGVDPETALRSAVARLMQRVRTAEKMAGAALDEVTPEICERVWSASAEET